MNLMLRGQEKVKENKWMFCVSMVPLHNHASYGGPKEGSVRGKKRIRGAEKA